MQEITAEDLKTIADQIVGVADPLKVILFGSHARGTAGPNSDIDLIVIGNRPKAGDWSRRRTVGDIRRSIKKSKRPIDILFYTPDEIDRWKNARNHLIHTALTEGSVIYERS